MAERAKFFDDIAGVARGAFSTLAGVGQELGAIVRTRVDEALAKLALVRREEFDVVSELAATARAGQEAAETRLADLERRVAALEPGAVASAAVIPEAAPHDPHGVHGAPGVPPEAV